MYTDARSVLNYKVELLWKGLALTFSHLLLEKQLETLLAFRILGDFPTLHKLSACCRICFLPSSENPADSSASHRWNSGLMAGLCGRQNEILYLEHLYYLLPNHLTMIIAIHCSDSFLLKCHIFYRWEIKPLPVFHKF